MTKRPGSNVIKRFSLQLMEEAKCNVFLLCKPCPIFASTAEKFPKTGALGRLRSYSLILGQAGEV
jgi:hypothetical protein